MMKILPVWASCFMLKYICTRTDGRRDMTKLIETFRNFATTYKNLVIPFLLLIAAGSPKRNL